jgi:uncharacterized protein (DUF983 family)
MRLSLDATKDEPNMTCVREEITMRKAAGRALLGKCPCCGKGQLFARYLKQVENCSACGESYGSIRADDAAPWLTIIVVGHILLPLAFMIDLSAAMPVWGEMLLWSSFFAAISIALLPRAKGLMIAILWRTRAPGYYAS